MEARCVYCGTIVRVRVRLGGLWKHKRIATGDVCVGSGS